MKRNILILTIGLVLLALVTPYATEDMRKQQVMLNDVTTGSSVIDDTVMSQCRESAVYIVWGASTSAGAVTIESAHDNDFTGTWAPLAVISWSADAKQDLVQITGVHMNLRTRISTNIVGGNVITYFICN